MSKSRNIANKIHVFFLGNVLNIPNSYQNRSIQSIILATSTYVLELDQSVFRLKFFVTEDWRFEFQFRPSLIYEIRKIDIRYRYLARFWLIPISTDADTLNWVRKNLERPHPQALQADNFDFFLFFFSIFRQERIWDSFV